MNRVVSVGGDNELQVSIVRPVLNTLLRHTGQSVILTFTIHIPSLGLPHKYHLLCGWHTISERVIIMKAYSKVYVVSKLHNCF